nr:hypothetical protein GZ17C7_32 [uncultured archaeon GZfos17C7]
METARTQLKETTNHSYSSAGDYVVNLTVTDEDDATNTTSTTIRIQEKSIFDTGPGTYPSISGTHKGTITPSKNITVHKLYTYPCEGTGGHTEYIWIYGNGINESASWNGYSSDWHYIRFDNPFVLEEGKKYNYTIITGSIRVRLRALSKFVNPYIIQVL